MSNEDANSRLPSWRNAGGKQPQGASGKRGWQQKPAAPAGGAAKKPISKSTKLGIAAALLVLVLGGIWYLIIMPNPPKLSSILLVGSGYETNLLLPPNVLGFKGVDSVSAWAKNAGVQSVLGIQIRILETKTRMKLVPPPEPTAGEPYPTWKAIAAELRKSDGKDQKSNPENQVLFLSLHGGADSPDQGAYLLANDPTGQAKIYLKEIFQEFQDPRYKDKNIIVVLDATHVESHWPIGMVRNDFVSALKKDFEKHKLNNLFVLCSCDENQRSWGSEEYQKSMFAHYFEKGLRGNADKGKNGEIDLLELFEYLELEVNDWAQRNRARIQKPFLLHGCPKEKIAAARLVIYDANDDERKQDERPGATWKGWSDGLEIEWKNSRVLADNKPWTFAPQVWREYMEALLRWEHLERACKDGDNRTNPYLDDHVGRLDGVIKKCKDQIQKLRVIPGPDLELCRGNCLPVAGALGFLPDSTAKLKVMFENDLPTPLGAGKEDRDKAVKEIENFSAAAKKSDFSNPLSQHALQALIGRLTLERLHRRIKNAAPKDSGKETAPKDIENFVMDEVQFWTEMERVLDVNNAVRPIEMHFLRMLGRDVIPKSAGAEAPLDLLPLALQVRSLAEEVVLSHSGDGDKSYSYSEFVFPWIKAEVLSADNERRLGEDLLFGPKESWPESGKKLKNAQVEYGEIKKKAIILKKAFDERDHAWNELPDLALWIAQQQDNDRQVKIKDWTKEIKNLTDELRKLTKDLEKPAALPAVNSKIESQTKLVKNHRNVLRDAVLNECKSLANPVMHHPNYHNIEAVLSCAWIDVDLRRKLIDNSRSYTRSWTASPVKGQPIQRDHAEFFKRQTDLASTVYDVGPEETLAMKLQKLEENINGFPKDLTEPKMIASTQDCRLLPGGMAGIVKSSTFTPPDWLRRVRTHELLFGLADRTYMDHWFDLDGKKTYYQDAADRYLNGAMKAIDDGTQKKPGAKGLVANLRDNLERYRQDKLNPRSELNIEQAKFYDWTTEKVVNLKIELKATTPAPPAGVPTVWQHVGDEPAPRARESLVKMIDNMAAKQDLPVQLREADWKGGKDVKDLKVNVQGRYRGQKLETIVALKKHDPTLIVHHHTPPKQANFAVLRDKEFKYGAVSVIMDTSGSMSFCYPTRVKADGKHDSCDAPGRRYDKAIPAFKQVLDALPDGTDLSMLRFTQVDRDELEKGKIVKVQKTVPEFVRLNEDGKQNSVPLDRDRSGRLMKRLATSELDNASPIANAIVKSMNEGFPALFQGPKIVLVLTDGCDNYSHTRGGDYDKDKRKQNTNGVKELLHKANQAHPDVTVIVVCFIPDDGKGKAAEADKADLATAREQFGIITEFKQSPGHFREAKDAAELTTIIDQLMTPILRVFDNDVKPYPIESGKYPWQRLNKKLHEPYEIQPFRKGNQNYEVAIKRGQNVLMVLKSDLQTGVPFLQRAVVGEHEDVLGKYPGVATKPSDWRLTLIEQEHDSENTLWQRVMVESRSHKKGIVQQAPLPMVWMEVAPRQDKAWKGVVEFENYWQDPASSYRLRARDWPPTKNGIDIPSLNVWWSDKTIVFERGEKREVLEQYRKNGKEFPVGDARNVFIEDYTEIREDHLIRNSRGELEKRQCVVIRIRHNPEQRIFIKPVYRADEMGEEHTYFDNVGKYTAKFYWTDDESKDELQYHFLSLSKFKEDAAKEARTAEVSQNPNLTFWRKLALPKELIPPAPPGP